mmetsp:Transcript_19705/g.30423  ORF Transcript_19705/g.30423 Transcript_19705/m.30423 type:complete len:99 (+) Transcript_19705:527-823(+)
MLNLLSRKPLSELPKYCAISFICPFFGFAPRRAHKVIPGMTLSNVFKQNTLGELVFNEKVIPQHLHHWLHDFETPMRLTELPIWSLMEFRKEISLITQ